MEAENRRAALMAAAYSSEIDGEDADATIARAEQFLKWLEGGSPEAFSPPPLEGSRSVPTYRGL